MPGQVVRNKKVILKDYTHGKVNETDMEVREGNICLQLQSDKNHDVLVKNLYLSPDPYMRSRMKGVTDSYIPPFTPGEVRFAFLEKLPSFFLFASFGHRNSLHQLVWR